MCIFLLSRTNAIRIMRVAKENKSSYTGLYNIEQNGESRHGMGFLIKMCRYHRLCSFHSLQLCNFHSFDHFNNPTASKEEFPCLRVSQIFNAQLAPLCGPICPTHGVRRATCQIIFGAVFSTQTHTLRKQFRCHDMRKEPI